MRLQFECKYGGKNLLRKLPSLCARHTLLAALLVYADRVGHFRPFFQYCLFFHMTES